MKSLLRNHYVLLICVLALLYIVPGLCGFPTWPGAATTSKLIKYDNVWDYDTFASDHRPIREFIAGQLWAGRLAFWLPTSILGLPLLEQYEYQILNPLEWLTYLGHDTWWTIVLCGYLLVGALGIFSICKRVGLDKAAAFGGALSYIAAGQVVLFYSIPSWAAVIPLIPWIVYCLASLIIYDFSSKSFLGLWASVTLLLLTGQPQIISCTAYFSIFFALALVIASWLQSRDIIRVAKALLLVSIAGVLALVTAAPQIIPFASFVLTPDAFTGHSFTIKGWYITAINFLNIFFPYSMGTIPYENWTADRLIRFQPSEDFPIGYYCTGGFLAVMGLIASFRSSSARPERTTYAVTSIFLLATIGLYGIARLPVWPLEFVHLARYSCPVLAVFISVLIGLGLQSLRTNNKLEVVLAASAISLSAMIIIYISFANFKTEIVKSFPVLYQVSFLSITSFLAAVSMVWIAVNPNEKTLKAAILIFFADAAFQLRYGFDLSTDAYRIIPFLILLSGALFYNFGSRQFFGSLAANTFLIVAGWVYFAMTQVTMRPPPEVPVASDLANHRIATSLVAYSADLNTSYGISVLGSRNPITFNSLQEFLFAAGPDMPAGSATSATTIRDWRGFGAISASGIPWPLYCTYRKRYNAIGVDMLVGYRGEPIDNLPNYPGCEDGLRPVDFGSNRFSGYIDEEAYPRAYLASSCREATSSTDAQPLFKDIRNLKNSPFVERGSEALTCESMQSEEAKSLKVKDVSPSEVEINVEGLGKGFAVLNDQFFGSWAAYIDGKKVDILRVNLIMRGVVVPDGARLIRFSYEPKLTLPLLLSLAGTFSALGIGFGLWRRRLELRSRHDQSAIEQF